MIDYWYDDNGWGAPEYSYVMHDKERNQDGLQMLHTHVVTLGTYNLGDNLGRMDHVVRRAHIKNLHEISGEVFQGELERILGRQRAAQIIHERDVRDLERRYPGLDERKRRWELADRRSKMRQVRDVMSIMRARAGRVGTYIRYHRLSERRRRQQGYAERQAEWERRRRQWREEHLDDLYYARLQDETRWLRREKKRRQREREGQRQRHHETLTRHLGRQQAELGMVSFGEAGPDEAVAGLDQSDLSAPSPDR